MQQIQCNKTNLITQVLESCGYSVHVISDIMVEAHSARINGFKYIKISVPRVLLSAWDFDLNNDSLNPIVYTNHHYHSLKELRRCITTHNRLRLPN